MALYGIKTERFGVLLVERDRIVTARAFARSAFGVRCPQDVWRVRAAHYCDRCESAPCVCPPE